MLTAEEIADKLKDRNLRKVAEACGVGHPTVWRLSKYPEYGASYEVVKAVSDYLEGKNDPLN